MLERIAKGQWIITRMRVVAWSTLAITIAMIGWLALGAHGTLDAFGRPLGTDFSDVWTAGLMADQGRAAQAWDWPLHYAVQQQVHHSTTVPFYGWHYPPPFLLLAVVLAQIPYVPALIVWQVVTLGMMLLLVRAITGRADVILYAIGAPVVLICLGHGQNAFLTASLLGGGMMLLDRRPLLAGLLLGCLAYKPQFAVLIPAILIVSGNWRAFIGATISVLALCGLTWLIWGWPVWQAFIDSLALTRTIVIEQGNTGWEKIQSGFSAIRMWGGSVPLAYAVQTCLTIGAIGAAMIASRRTSMSVRGAAVLSAALLCTPYVLDYDFVILGVAIAFLARDQMVRGVLDWEISLMGYAWIVPLFGRQVTALTGIPLELIAAITMLAVAVRRAILLDGALRFRSWPFRRSHALSGR